MAKTTIDIEKKIKNVRLKQEVAELIISTQCFGNVEKQDIVEKVCEVHKKLGGKETATQTAQGAITAALKSLVEQGKASKPFKGIYHFPGEEENGKGSVYLYYFPAYKELAEEKGEEFWECKIGKTIEDVQRRVKSQVTGNPEKADNVLEMKTDHPKELESALHAILKLRGRHVTEGGGREWFKTHPDEVKRIHFFLTSLESKFGTG